MTTLITGGAGFIGSRLAAHLLEKNEPVVILDNLDPYYDVSIKRANLAALGSGAEFIEGDIRDEALVQRIFSSYPIKRVAHLAAMAGVRYSIDNGRLYSDVNTSGSVTLMDESRRHGIEVFVHTSTSSVYGRTQRIPFREADPPDEPLAPYPASKRAAELFAHTYHHLFKLNVTVLRLFNVYGPGGRPDMMPIKTIEAILNGKPIQAYGGGSLQRDWTYVDDCVAGIAAALERPMGYQIINLGCGRPISLTAFIQIYEGLIGKKAIIQDAPIPDSEPLITYCDNSRARDLLGFNPQTPIEEGLRQTWEWYRQHYRIDR